MATRSGKPAPGRLHVLTDECLQTRYSHVELARLAAEGGADVVQYRDKRVCSSAERLDIATAMLEALNGHRCRLIVNDAVDVARDSGALAVHLGRLDTDPAEARRCLGDEGLIGVTANDLDQARRAAALPIDYLGVGPIFGTDSKDNPAAKLGLDGLSAIARAVSLPVIAIGGIGAADVPEVLAAGAHGVAVLSAISCAANPREATRAFRLALDQRAPKRSSRSVHANDRSG